MSSSPVLGPSTVCTRICFLLFCRIARRMELRACESLDLVHPSAAGAALLRPVYQAACAALL